MGKSFDEWLSEGDALYTQALEEYRDLEKQLADLQEKLAAKRSDVNKIAKVINKPAVEPIPASISAPPPSSSNVTTYHINNGAQEVIADVIDPEQPAVPSSRESIARALAGKPLRR